jgi:hypothetical protein
VLLFSIINIEMRKRFKFSITGTIKKLGKFFKGIGKKTIRVGKKSYGKIKSTIKKTKKMGRKLGRKISRLV